MPSLAEQIFDCFEEEQSLSRRDLPALSCYDSMGRGLGQLVREGRLVRVGRGRFRRAVGNEPPASCKTLHSLIAGFIERSDHSVFLRSDFSPMGDSSAVSGVLRAMVESGCLLRLGRGIYVRAVQLRLGDAPRPIEPVSELVAEAAERLGLKVLADPCDHDDSGKAVSYRISRRIGYGQHFVFVGD